MKKVRKLTPATLKRIIAEEKFKLLKESKTRKSGGQKRTTHDAQLLREIKKLLLLKSK